METNLEGVLTLKNSAGELIAIFYNDMKKRTQVCYKVKEAAVDEIKALFDGEEKVIES